MIRDINGADIGGDGLAVDQTIDLFNYYQRLTAAPNADIVQYAIQVPESLGGPEPVDLTDRIITTTAPKSSFEVLNLESSPAKTSVLPGIHWGGNLH